MDTKNYKEEHQLEEVKISNLDKCPLLTKLYLYNNQIKKIEHLEKLKKLQVLWLNSNSISVIENLISLKYLKDLNLADNKIIKIGKGLQQNINLENLNLSANKITFLKATIEKKVIFYDSKKKQLEYKKNCWLDAALNLRTRLLTGYYMYVEQLARLLQMIENIPLPETEKHTRQKTIHVTLEKCEAKYQRVILKFKEALFFMEKSYNFGLYMVDTELITCGNVKFEEPSLIDSWYDCCCDMILDNFCKWDFQQLDISGIDVLSVFKVINRAVSLRFDNYLMSLISLPDEGYNLTDQLHEFRKKQDYLFWMPSENSDSYLLEKILQDGFSFSRYAQAQNEDNAIKLYNCLYFADLQRLKNLGMRNHTESEDSFQIKYGRLLICRVFTGNPVMIEDDKKFNPANYPQFTSFYKTKKMLLKQSGFLYSVNDHPACRCLQNQREWHIYNPGLIVPEYIVKFKYNFTDEIMNPFLQLKEPYQDVSEEVEKKFLSQWISLNENTYIQDMIKNLTEEVYETYNKSYTDGNIEPSLLSEQNVPSTITHLNLSRQNLNKLNIAKFLPSLVKLEASFNNFTSLDLFYPDLSNLKYFDLSWNCLTDFTYSLNVLKQSALNLDKLNVAYNHWHEPHDLRIQLLFYLKNLEAINGIEVSNDERQRVVALTKRYQTRMALLKRRCRLDIRSPRILSLHNKAQVLVESSKCVFQTIDIAEDQMFLKNLKNLTIAHFSGNPMIEEHEDYRSYVIFHLRGLHLLDGIPVESSQVSAAKDLFGGCLTLDLITERFGSVNNELQELNLPNSNIRTVVLGFADTLYNLTRYNEIKSLVQLQLFRLPSLRALFLQGNEITKVDGIEQLTNLSELILDANKIRTLSPQSFSGQLNLLELHLEENRLISLAALGQLTKLQRLYVGSNKIQEVQELEHLKSLESLTEISLANNSISKKPQMRHILINQSPMLTAINGNVITEEDRIKADAYFMERIGQTKLDSLLLA
ncbi:leucine-rich repeat-containing protein 9-like isoform X4 [Octopus vulgaris]|uniref:Leucine-rich repeat-containing protein 9-like isoform X4 n=1 Tax=Octopus vulgaris TaxID=6645 RepID=A0AA36F856_OCTVU|nr:leucine-rich repeat-containing protein 9-like isoform X4 [Octopus vulgaris]